MRFFYGARGGIVFSLLLTYRRFGEVVYSGFVLCCLVGVVEFDFSCDGFGVKFLYYSFFGVEKRFSVGIFLGVIKESFVVEYVKNLVVRFFCF